MLYRCTAEDKNAKITTMMIEQWLEDFHAAWKGHDVPRVMELFTDDVQYYETPFRKIASKLELEKEWQVILNQHDIQVSWDVFCSSADGKHAVMWELSYVSDVKHISRGTYLIGLENSGLCNFFYYTSESERSV